MIDDKLYSIWGNVSTDDRMFFLINESAMLIWGLRKAGDKTRLENFRRCLKADLDFADDELRELEIRNKIQALRETSIDKATADELAGLAEEIHKFLDFETDTLSA